MSTLAEVRAQINAISDDDDLPKDVALSLCNQGLSAIISAIIAAGDAVFGGILPGERTRANVRDALYRHRDAIESSFAAYFYTASLKNDVMRAYYELAAVDEGLIRFQAIMSPRQLAEDFRTSASEFADAAIPAFKWGTIALVGVGLVALALAIGAKRVTA